MGMTPRLRRSPSFPPQPASSWELIIVSILTMIALIGMLWPLF
jgi:hypothetical protein